ncbi:hypothetical protein DT075_09225 [Bacillus licheniformis]|nr:hypothetical protein DT075_09225 [Bacillus licheniformis]
MTVFAANGTARTFNYRAGDVGYVPFAMGHYIQNTGSESLWFLEIFKSSRFADIYQKVPDPYGTVPKSFAYRLFAQKPIVTPGGTVRIVDSSNFPISTAIAAALVEVKPGGMREMHWHPN